MSERVVIDVVPEGSAGGWRAELRIHGETATKLEALEAATSLGRLLEERGVLAQVVVRKRDGTIEEERTYGSDPERRPG